ncbi:MAG: creatininase family protein [Bacillota bacterium]
MEKYLLNEMSSYEAEKALQEAEVVIIPIGSFEQHGPHLPLKTDHTLTYERACKIAEITDTVIAQILNLGYSHHHLGFPGTISLSNETLISVLKDVALSLSYSGVKKILFLNGHGGNDNALSMAEKVIEEDINISVAVFGVSDITTYSPKEYKGKFDIHAGVQETAAMYIYDQDSVREDKIEKPELIIDFDYREIAERFDEKTANKIFYKKFKKIKDLSSNGVITTLDPKNAKDFIENREKMEKLFIESVVNFISAWKKY